ncbi:fumarylacetoacetate hydrolase family protein [Nocardioides marmotae]|uniref:Fumarylacetoacetase-like C-terminal domain-containing protein n=1 Tax=Nocardioides marmotae TaxID=2663857 RepID=A0A6I3JF94_9ACTN|nr:fumarylacetoacetate hydrolase family protein [Nocardioides marmotae]MCR6033097.1 hypothetical protein [Gordonia jinghuaiqii]MBC9732597.1 fumarylacetoacetate hydrolase family protein [Nocardioides marmotae]MTB83716.1 hypothetical protein [Nocardioides marmotae]MTB96749.1 hypothetical protein [Nocardioides marmotae]QKE03042.1 hypothetical protein HPC71_19750 [Nocardioides marmotae]
MSALDPRIAQGTARMLAARDRALARGAGALGWKAGFGAPAALASWGTDRPLVGFLTRDRQVASGALVEVSRWAKPVLEAEVAAHLAADLGPGASPEEALASVGGWSVAIELADVSFPPHDLGQVLADNIFHRHVLLGPVLPERPSPLSFSVRRDGEEVSATADPEALTGELGAVLASMAGTLGACGAALVAGDVVITGSVVAPLPAAAGRWVADAGALGAVQVTLR